jgi:hypothetical protein
MAGDMSRAALIADLIFSEWRSGYSTNPEDELEKIGHKVPAQDRQDVEIHMILAGSHPRLFKFEFCEFDEGLVPSSEEEKSRFIAGDKANAAVFWAERYHLKSASTEQLIPLAAHLIVSASKINNGGIGGLDIVLCRSGFSRLSDNSIKQLEQKAEEWDRTIGDLFLNYRRQTTYTLD